ncbi:MAG: dipeptidase [Acidobacteriia bacterium]|nr:dipeptidase [Terriglobia bacterium]
MPADVISLRAREIHFSTIVIDTHADTPQRFLFDQFDMGHHDAEGCVDIPRLRAGGVSAIVFALWVPVEITGPAATARAFDLLAGVEDQIRRHPDDLTLATTAGEVRAARKQNKIGILLGVEGGHAINNDLQVLRQFAARGVRTMTLTHNAATDWADSSNAAARHNGLTDFGREVVHEMNRLGMLVDVSHVSDQTFRDVIETSRAPVIASHSCCRAICGAPRNLSDELILALAARGGVLHVTFHAAFLSQEYANASRAMAQDKALLEQAARQKFGMNEAQKLIEEQRTSDEWIRAGKLPQVGWGKIIEHIDHAVRLAGADHVGLGSDFDGAFMPEGLEDAAQFPRITEGLFELGYDETDIAKILGGNTLRVMSESERVAGELQQGNP